LRKPLAKQEALAERVVGVEREDVLARAVRAPLDFGYDGRDPRNISVAVAAGGSGRSKIRLTTAPNRKI